MSVEHSTESAVIIRASRSAQNKGYAVAEFFQRFTDAPIDNYRWFMLMMRNATPGCRQLCCGICKACRRRGRIAQVASARVQVHAFELLPSNANMLRSLAALALPSWARVEVHTAAVGNESGATVYVRDSGVPGYEASSAQRRASRGSVAVRTMTVDAVVAEHSIERIAWLSIDAEGWDGLVLRGARRTLERRMVDLLEFEYLRRWAMHLGPRPLWRTLEWLRGIGYSCFWQDHRGRVARASAPCWRDEFEQTNPMAWRNIFCSHRPDLVALAAAREEREQPNKKL